MELASFYLRAGIQILCFLVTFYAMQAVNFSRLLKQDHPWQAQILYWIVVCAFSWMLAQFVDTFIYRL